MKHEQIWAPWRLDYVVSADEAKLPAPTRPVRWREGADPQCFFCRNIAEAEGTTDAAAGKEADRENLVVFHTELSILVLNRYPYNNGHLLIAPRRHRAEPADLEDEEHLDLMQELTRAIAAMRRLMDPHGFNVGLNLGRVAGAGLPGHLHWHLVPRWNGDTNFMPVLAGIRVIPQSLDALWEALSQELRPDR